ncbi:MAG TPA: carboxypeptidase-like regulatory domain-containing protein, partial [Longimicrobiales bacterium]
MLKFALIVLAFFGVVADAAAQVVRGTVRDAETGAPLQGVFVMLVDSAGQMRGGVLTNAQGTYATRAPLAGTF